MYFYTDNLQMIENNILSTLQSQVYKFTKESNNIKAIFFMESIWIA